MSKQTSLQGLVEPVVESMGYELVGVEYMSQGRHSILRIYIDKPDGINVDDCTAVSGQISALLDVEDPIRGEYNLEISSPGLDRPLFNCAHYQQYVGNECKIRMKVPVNGQRKFTGIIKAASEDSVELEVDNEIIPLSLSMIDKANLVPKF